MQEFKILLISTASSKRLGLLDGIYELCFGADSVMLKLDGTVLEAWNYSLLTWCDVITVKSSFNGGAKKGAWGKIA